MTSLCWYVFHGFLLALSKAIVGVDILSDDLDMVAMFTK